ncbi:MULTISPECIES: DUF397 domain-containing protein [Micromonospora]|uniref:DUF397 domain-containing protein n=1 Tax=Micromonospora wenchangensis TaxID=1185415 RepID=A0A246RMV3_9ACTN|nr:MULTISPECIES: DUF397 domain-containing protein [Micromonospora]OWV08469.1 DUF397 domain-containing protein [Micromonospora wenchangensis]QDY07500.1 DUF397 domain-containing protein [Micromonospora sp. HM134]
MQALPLSMMDWRTSSRSSGNGNCVEIASTDDRIAVRDSKDRCGPALVFSADAWTAFVTGMEAVRRV